MTDSVLMNEQVVVIGDFLKKRKINNLPQLSYISRWPVAQWPADKYPEQNITTATTARVKHYKHPGCQQILTCQMFSSWQTNCDFNSSKARGLLCQWGAFHKAIHLLHIWTGATIISSTLSQPTIKHKNYLIFFSSKDNSWLIILLIIMG